MADLASNGIRVDLLESSQDFRKQSLTIIPDSEERLTQVTVWETGEMEIEFAQVSSGDTFQEHKEAIDPSVLQEFLERLTEWTLGTAPYT